MITHTITRVTCPAEVTAPLPAVLAMPLDAVLDGTRSALSWVAARFAREDALAQRLTDARAQCPAPDAAPDAASAQ